jgi:hypothetical protein
MIDNKSFVKKIVVIVELFLSLHVKLRDYLH